MSEEIETKHIKNYSSIVIAGGALKLISVIGCIKYLEELNLIKNLKNMVGSSAGSIISLCLALNYSSKEMQDLFSNIINELTLTDYDLEQTLNMFQSYGLNNGNNINKLVEKILYIKTGHNDITFIELAKLMGKNLVVCVSNITKQTEEYLSVDTNPNMSVLLAIRMSCSIPILFTPISYNDNVYIDGGIYNNFPLEYFKNNMEDIIGINIKSKSNLDTTSFINYITYIISIISSRISLKLENNRYKNIFTIEIDDSMNNIINILDIGNTYSKEKINEIINQGYNIIKNQFISYYQ